MNFRSNFQRTPPIVLNLIIINALVFFAQSAFGNLEGPSRVTDLFALHHYKAKVFEPYQIVTHMFMHGSLMHLLFNMFGLWMFGGLMENLWGPKRFLSFYLICGLVAGFAQLGSYAYTYWGVDHALLSSEQYELYQSALLGNATVGASGAIMGLLAAYGYTFPNTQLFVFPIPFPIKAKWAISGVIVLDILGGLSNSTSDNVAHFAHLGGALAGFIIVFFWNKNNRQQFY